MIRFDAAADGRACDVLIGPMEEAAGTITALADAGPMPVVTDERLWSLYGGRLGPVLPLEPLLVPEGEAAKCWDVLRMLIERLAALGASRSTPVIAFGGGSVGDVAGLAASIYKRGSPVVHIPTTLLAQVDSALGGKTGIDALGQKNLVGTFHVPAIIVADPAFLGTLGAAQLRSGYAEVVKCGLIDDSGFFRWCEDNGAMLLRGDASARAHAIEHCLRAKARFVADDPRDTTGRRALLNLGHSFGHAIESLAGLDRVLHGEAVAVGLTMAFDFSVASGLCARADAQRVRQHLEAAGLPVSLEAVGLAGRGAEMMPLIRQDKKADRGTVNLILARGIGRSFLARDVGGPNLAAFLNQAP